MLADTDVLIWNLRGNARAAAALDQAVDFSISSVTYMELIQGMRNQAELRAVRQALHYWGAEVVHVNPAISARACFLMEERFLAQSMGLADALIAATALELGAPLLTANVKHYRGIDGLDIEIFRP